MGKIHVDLATYHHTSPPAHAITGAALNDRRSESFARQNRAASSLMSSYPCAYPDHPSHLTGDPLRYWKLPHVTVEERGQAFRHCKDP